MSFWDSVAKSEDRAQYEAYLAQYPNGTFSGLAKAKISALSPAIPAPAAVSAPVPAAVPIAAAVPPSPVVAAAPAFVAAPVAVPQAALAPAAAAVSAPASASPPSLLDQLAAVGKGGVIDKPTFYVASGPVPARPEMAPIAAVTLPDHFCSAVERNSFHDTVYVPAVALADRNNAATIAHLSNVQALHAQALSANNVAGANALAHEATDYKPIADQAYSARSTMTDLFARIMAVPVTGC